MSSSLASVFGGPCIAAIVIVLAVGLASCGGGNTATGRAPLPGYQPDPSLYGVDADPSRLLDVGGEGDEVVRAAPDLVVLLLANGLGRVDADRLADLVGGQVVGQVPDVSMFQIRLTTRDKAGLDAAIALLASQPGVDSAGYDLVLEPLATSCPVVHDNQRLASGDRCAFDDIESNEALTLFESWRPSLQLTAIRVGIVDSGLNGSHAEFQDQVIIDSSGRDGTWTKAMDETDPKKPHGTIVAAMMAAADDVSGIDGLARRFLGDSLTLVFGKMTGSTFTTIVSMRRVVDLGVRIVNCSFGLNRLVTDQPAFRSEWKAFYRLLEAHPDVLWVVAAPNQPFEMTRTNHAPAGILLPNVLAVGGTQACKPMERYIRSATGTAIDIAAPAQDIIAIQAYRDAPMQYVSGNSIAAPQVTSLAAILRSIQPSLSPSALRDDYIRGMANFGADEVNGRLLNFPMTLGRLLLDLQPPLSGDIRDGIDHEPDGKVDATMVQYCRLCGCTSSLEVVGVGTYQATSTDEALGTMSTESFGFMMTDGATYDFYLNCPLCRFDLREFPIGAGSVADLATAQFHVMSGRFGIGQSLSGALQIESCRIGERVNDLASLISVTGSYGGEMKLTWADPYEEEATSFQGRFEAGFVAADLPGDDPLTQLLESKCEGGRQPPKGDVGEMLALPGLRYSSGSVGSGAATRYHMVATTLSQAEADAWTAHETAPAGSGSALHLVLPASAWPAEPYQPLTLAVSPFPDCALGTPAAVPATGIRAALYDWAGGHATARSCATSGQVTLEATEDGVLNVTLEAGFDGGVATQWPIRFPWALPVDSQ